MKSKEPLSLSESNSDVSQKKTNVSDVTNIFDKTPKKERLRETTKNFDHKVKLFCALHFPIGVAKLYHFIVLFIIYFSIIALNLIDEETAKVGQLFNTSITYFKLIVDSVLIIILSVEIILRMWSSDVIVAYKGLSGRLLYLKDYAFWRGIDFFGIIVFLANIVNHIYFHNYEIDSNIRISHLTQVFQIHRLLYRYLKAITQTIVSQSHHLIIVLIFGFLTLLLSAFAIYLTERESNPNINHFFDAFWMTFITFATIGYGDVVPVTSLGRCTIILCSIFGVLFFELPGSILGTGLALHIQEAQKRVQFHKIPAIRFIQSIWRCYVSNQDSSTHWKLYKRKDKEPLTEEDRICIRFIKILTYLKQRQRFKILIGLLNDDFFRERSTRELSRRLKMTEIDIKDIKHNMNKTFDKRDKTNDVLNKLISKLNEIIDQNKDKKVVDIKDKNDPKTNITDNQKQ